jgi:hypothetical protein
MDQAKQWLKIGREHGNNNNLVESLMCFRKASDESPCWSLPYIFSGVICVKYGHLGRAESLFAVARTLAALKSHPPIKSQICDILRKGEITCRSKAGQSPEQTYLFPDNYPSTYHLSFSPEVFADDILQDGNFRYLHEECIVTGDLK